jgi:transcriptional regulator with XRE-family HTH domain
MKDELRGWDPYPLKQKGEGEPVYWDEGHLERRERFKDLIRPAELPETARGLGGKLRRTREARGISIAQAAQSTFIQARYLEAIERGQIENLPGGLYTRRFIELYAQFLNFDGRAVSRALLPGTTVSELIKDSFSGVVNYNSGRASSTDATETKLPRLGEVLLYYFLSEEERDGFIGDVEETYSVIEVKFGTRAAEIFFYKEILNSMSPLLARFIARVILAMLNEMK